MVAAAHRIGAIALNTYRESVRARILFGLFALALATALYSIAVGEFALRNASRVVADLGTASFSLYAIVAAVVIGATSLYRELEQKTLFPILARPIRRSEYLVGKYLGTLLVLAVFVAIDASAVLLILARHGGRGFGVLGAVVLGLLALLGLALYLLPRHRSYVPIPWAALCFVAASLLASGAADDRRVVLLSSVLCLGELMIVVALSSLFSSFSSPFLSAVFTVGMFIVGRETDVLGRLPARVFGAAIHGVGAALAKSLPNLQVYVPPRPLLLGEVPGLSLGGYIAMALAQAIGWSIALVAVANVVFSRRDLS